MIKHNAHCAIPLTLTVALSLACGVPEESTGHSTNALTITSFDGDTSRVLPAGERTRLSITVTDLAGTPRQGVDVLFVAPDAIAGRFDGASSLEPNYLRAQTDGDGIAQTTWTAGTIPAAYLIDIHVDGQQTFTSVAISQAKGPVPAVSAAAATARARQLITAPGSKLIGPFLLQAGDSIRPAQDDALFPRLVAGPTWFFWTDHAPDTAFAHDTSFLFVNATNNLSPVFPSSERWWPVLTTGARRYELRTPSATNDRLEAPVAALRPLIIGRTRSALTAQQTQKTCAIVGYGPKDRSFRANQKEMVRFFKEVMGLPSTNVFSHEVLLQPKPITYSAFLNFLAATKVRGCDRIFIYLTGHGNAEDIDLADANEKKDPRTYSQLARAVAAAYPNGEHVNVIIDACDAGAAVGAFQARGLNGRIITASDIVGASKHSNGWFGRFRAGSAFTFELIEAWTELMNGCPHLDQVFLRFQRDASGRAKSGGPLSEPILPTGQRFSAPNFSLEVGDVAQGPITGPPTASGGSPYTVASPAIADLVDLTAPGQYTPLERLILVANQTKRLFVLGKAPGTTTYSIVVRSKTSTTTYQAVGNIEVRPKQVNTIGGGLGGGKPPGIKPGGH